MTETQRTNVVAGAIGAAMREELIARCADALRPKAVFALVFGSVLTEGFGSESDVDCAAFLPKTYDYHEYFELQEELAEVLNRKVDLIQLNDADHIITMQVLANGRLLFANDHSRYVIYKATALSRYLDFKQSRLLVERNILKGLAHA